MARISDTAPEAERFLRRLLRTMPFESKWRQMGVLYHTGKVLHEAGMRYRCRDVTPEQIHADWVGQFGRSEIRPPRADRMALSSSEATQIAEHLIRVLTRLKIAHAITGAWASSLHGKMRFTYDLNLCVEPFAGKEDSFCAALGEDYHSNVDMVQQAVQAYRSFRIICMETAYKIDLFVVQPRPFHQSMLARRQVRRLGPPQDIEVGIVSAEDIILLKLEAYRKGDASSAQQWLDALGVVETQGDYLDHTYLDHWAAVLGVTDLLERARQEGTPP